MSKQAMQGGRNWYAIHTYSGYEDAVARNLKQRIETMGMEEKIFNIVVPMEKKVKIHGGKRKIIEEEIYPGYVLVDMIVTDDSWYIVRNTPRVTGFVGSGTTPVPLAREEVDALFAKMGGGEPKYKVDFRAGDLVRISEGAFKDIEGRVIEIDEERGKIKTLISMFGRETPLELDFLQVKKI